MIKFVKANYEKRASVFKALGHPTRFWIVSQLSDNQEHCVCEFVDAIDADFSTISKHLAVLKNAGVISDDKRGKEVYYRLSLSCISSVVDCKKFNL